MQVLLGDSNASRDQSQHVLLHQGFREEYKAGRISIRYAPGESKNREYKTVFPYYM